MNHHLIAISAIAAAGIALAPPAQGQGMPTYEPQQRLRTPLDTCMKTEVLRGANCVRKCATDFRLDLSGSRPRCVGLKRDAKYDPQPPAYRPPARNPNARVVPGA